jgi:hypothetical protein
VREDEKKKQQELHEAIERTLENDDGILVGWIVVFETAAPNSAKTTAGHFYGPREMTTWRALGLIEWVRRFGLVPDIDDED